MPTKLDKSLKREVVIGDQTLVLTLTPDAVKMTAKGKRTGKTFTWADLWSGEAELASQLQASLKATGRDLAAETEHSESRK
jgi:hypothetical protein